MTITLPVVMLFLLGIALLALAARLAIRNRHAFAARPAWALAGFGLAVAVAWAAWVIAHHRGLS